MCYLAGKFSFRWRRSFGGGRRRHQRSSGSFSAKNFSMITTQTLISTSKQSEVTTRHCISPCMSSCVAISMYIALVKRRLCRYMHAVVHIEVVSQKPRIDTSEEHMLSISTFLNIWLCAASEILSTSKPHEQPYMGH